MAIGVSYDLFKHLNPTKLEPFKKAHDIKRKQRDEENWMLGQYFMSALDSTVCNSQFWRKKGLKPHTYIEKPLLEIAEEKKQAENLTEEEKRKQTEQLFLRLRLMESNFKLNKKNKDSSV